MLVFRVLFEELSHILHDKGVLLIFVAGLLVYAMFYPLPYSMEVVRDLPVVAIDRDQTALSRQLTRWADATEEVNLAFESGDMKEAERMVRDGDAFGIFVIPQGFERDVLRGEQAHVSAYADVTYFLIYRRIMTGLYKATATLSAGIEIRRFTASGNTEEKAWEARDPAPVVDLSLFNPVSGYASYVVPGVLPLILQQTLLIGMGMIGGTRRERWRSEAKARRQQGESRLAVLIGRALAYFAIYWPYPLFYVFVVYRIYGLASPGDISLVMLLMIPYVLAVVMAGLALNTVLFSREQSVIVLIGTSLPFVFLAGFAWPFDALPDWLYRLGLLIPSTAGVSAFLRINQMDAGLHDVWFEWCVLWTLCAFYLLLAWIGMGITGTLRFRESESAS
jgi:ABC-2 type transport system permease protein